jgi:hypothetical protein
MWKDKKCIVKSPRCTQRKYYESCIKDNLCYWDKDKCKSKKRNSTVARPKIILQDKIDDYLIKNLIGSKKSLEALGLILHKMIDLYIYNRRLQNSGDSKRTIKRKSIHMNRPKYIVKKTHHENNFNNDYNSERTMPINRWRPQIINSDNNPNIYRYRNDTLENNIEGNTINYVTKRKVVSVNRRSINSNKTVPMSK